MLDFRNVEADFKKAEEMAKIATQIKSLGIPKSCELLSKRALQAKKMFENIECMPTYDYQSPSNSDYFSLFTLFKYMNELRRNLITAIIAADISKQSQVKLLSQIPIPVKQFDFIITDENWLIVKNIFTFKNFCNGKKQLHTNTAESYYEEISQFVKDKNYKVSTPYNAIIFSFNYPVNTPLSKIRDNDNHFIKEYIDYTMYAIGASDRGTKLSIIIQSRLMDNRTHELIFLPEKDITKWLENYYLEGKL